MCVYFIFLYLFLYFPQLTMKVLRCPTPKSESWLSSLSCHSSFLFKTGSRSVVIVSATFGGSPEVEVICTSHFLCATMHIILLSFLFDLIVGWWLSSDCATDHRSSTSWCSKTSPRTREQQRSSVSVRQSGSWCGATTSMRMPSTNSRRKMVRIFSDSELY